MPKILFGLLRSKKKKRKKKNLINNNKYAKRSETAFDTFVKAQPVCKLEFAQSVLSLPAKYHIEFNHGQNMKPRVFCHSSYSSIPTFILDLDRSQAYFFFFFFWRFFSSIPRIYAFRLALLFFFFPSLYICPLT